MFLYIDMLNIFMNESCDVRMYRNITYIFMYEYVQEHNLHIHI